MNGIFITFEGPEGAGKTTIIQMIAQELEKRQVEIVSTREPGGIHISEQIREVILSPENTAMDGRTEALLYAAARRQHLVEKVIPALNRGAIVLCDRFIDSSLAYQGYARGLGMDEVLSINEFAIHDMMPTKTYYFDIEPELGLGRIQKNESREVNRLDMEKVDFHHKVREGYQKVCQRFSDRIITVDASQSIEVVFNEVFQSIQTFIEKAKA